MTGADPTLAVSGALLALQVNEAQRRAAHPRRSAWVSASAGSGKTKVLADRVTRLLLDDVPPHRILCLTFTRAAAAEMSIRLTSRLAKWASCADGELEEELASLLGGKPEGGTALLARRLFARVLACPGGMRIQTLHAFAQEILRRFPLEAGLVPHFSVMEEDEAVRLRAEAMTDLLRQAASGKESEAQAALLRLAPRLTQDRLEALLLALDKQNEAFEAALERYGSFEAVLQAQKAALDFSKDATLDGLEAEAAREGAFPRKELTRAARLLIEKGTKTYQARGQVIADWLALPDEDSRRQGMDAYSGAFLTQEGEVYAKLANKALTDEDPALASVMEDEALRLYGLLERSESLRNLEEGAALLFLARGAGAGYAARKAARAVLDYDDLIQKAIAVLRRRDIGPWVLFKLDGGIDHILLDESQDTNPSQWQIVQALAEEFFAQEGGQGPRPRTLFVVGDEKQSIYSFLKADPEAFARMHDFFAQRIRQAGQSFEDVPLSVSFRSAPAILRAVDAVFADPAIRRGVAHEPVLHSAFRAEGAGRVEVWPLFEAQKEDEAPAPKRGEPTEWTLPTGYESEAEPAAQLAAALARQIESWVRSGTAIYDKETKKTRPMTAGDVMVLVQRRGSFVGYLVRELKKLGVAVSGVDRMDLTQQLAVMDLLALVQFVLLPEDDLTLATLLRSPLIGAQEEDLMALAMDRGVCSLWERLGQEPRYAAWRSYLQETLAAADRASPLAFLMRALSLPCPSGATSGRLALAARLGPEAEDALDELLNAAEQFSSRHAPSLQAFLQWMSESEAEVKRELEQAMGRVRVTTVHASKGLEAPVVILPDTVYVPGRDKIAPFLWEEATGLPFYSPAASRNARLQALREAAYEKQMQEYRRLLYVALTRAADRLLICGYKGSRAFAFDQSWYAAIKGALTAQNQNAFQDDPASILVPDIVWADYALPALAPRLEASPETLAPLPAWAHKPAPDEPEALRPLIPSRASEDSAPPVAAPADARFYRGRAFHRLMQSLPALPPLRREAAALRYLEGLEFSPSERAALAAEALALLSDPRFAPLFGDGSRAEVPLIGIAGGRRVSGQVDRLAVKGDEVWVVDYKTNRPPPRQESGTPALYRTQMEAYRSVLKQIYPQHTIRCFLLWTYEARLMEILPRP